MGPKIASSGNLAPRASWEPPGLDFQAFWGSFWGSQIGRKTIPKMIRLFTAAPFFWQWPTLTIVWFLQYKSYFFSFGLVDVFHKKCLKIQPKMEAQKTTGKPCQGRPKIVLKCLKILEFCVEKCQLAPKRAGFCRVVFFILFLEQFLEPFWTNFGSQNGAKINEKTIQNSINISIGFLSGSWTVFDQFWYFCRHPGSSKMELSCRRGAIFKKIRIFRSDPFLD